MGWRRLGLVRQVCIEIGTLSLLSLSLSLSLLSKSKRVTFHRRKDLLLLVRQRGEYISPTYPNSSSACYIFFIFFIIGPWNEDMKCLEFDILDFSTTSTPRLECGGLMEPKTDLDDV